MLMRRRTAFGMHLRSSTYFTRFLVDCEGTVVARFEPTVKMDDVAQKVAELL